LRLRGLSRTAIQSLLAAAQALDLGRGAEAEQNLRTLLTSYPKHPEVLRLAGGLYSLRGAHSQAIDTLERAVNLCPGDALYWNTLGAAFIQAGNLDVAVEKLRWACALDPNCTLAWFNLALALMRSMRIEESATALRRTLQLSPEHTMAQVILGNMLRADNQTHEAIAQYRKILAHQPQAGMAWWGLADIKVVRFDIEDIARMRQIMQQTGLADSDFVAIGFALAKALEDHGQYAKSLAVLSEANERARRYQRWDAEAHSKRIDAVLNAFASKKVDDDMSLGEELIFVVSMPRSGSTLVEQILASHSQVEGAGELPDLPWTLSEESRQRGLAFPDWVGSMRPAAWRKLGRRYLDRTSRWRKARPRSVDKLPYNWLYVGAIRQMLPGARIVLCRRDPFETCFSCYRQHLADNEYTRTFTDLASFWRDFDRAIRHWNGLHPTAVHESIYEELIAEPEGTIRGLLDFCNLPFEQSCLTFEKTVRGVHTPSAMQVREPLRPDTARSVRYGSLLDPLRAQLNMPPFSPASF